MRRFVCLLFPIACILGQEPNSQKQDEQPTAIWSQEPNGFKGVPFDIGHIDASPIIYAGRCVLLEADTVTCPNTDPDIGTVSATTHSTFRDDRFVSASGQFD